MRTVIVAGFILMFGAFALFNSIGNARLKALQGSDVLQLVAVGLCFGAGITLLIKHFFS
ncbi:MAG TPA: hypothetical protein VGC42_18855 [Kofleriaceae bacterium]